MTANHNDVPSPWSLLWQTWLEQDISRLAAEYGAIREQFAASDTSNDFDDVLNERKARAEGLLFEALLIKAADVGIEPWQLQDLESEPDEDSVEIEDLDSSTLIAALAARWQKMRNAETPAEWAVLVRSEIQRLLVEFGAGSRLA